MKFKKIKKRKYYTTWASAYKIKGYKAYIFKMPESELYHFHICSEGDIVFASINENIIFQNFEECCKAVKKWIDIVDKR